MSAEILLRFFVPGVPRPGGSKRVFWNKKTGRPIVAPDNAKTQDWRVAVSSYAMSAMAGRYPFTGALCVDVIFTLPRPKAHYRADGTLRLDAPKYQTKKPDASKLMRSTEDAMTGIVYVDDAMIANQEVTKLYADPSLVGAQVTVFRLD